MKTQADTRKRKQINEKCLAAYTAAAGAALLATAPADAAVQYSGVVDVTLEASMRISKSPGCDYCTSQSGSYSFIDIDGNGIDDLKFQNDPVFIKRIHNGSTVTGYWDLAGGFSNLNGVSFAGQAGLPSNFGQGSIVDASKTWTNNNGKLFSGDMKIYTCTSCGFPVYGWVVDSVNSGNFRMGNPGYLGIRFDPGDGTKYGWIHIASVERIDTESFYIGSTYRYKIDGWAYDDMGQAIAAGQTTVVPEPTSVALFAAGAATLMAKRRRQKK